MKDGSWKYATDRNHPINIEKKNKKTLCTVADQLHRQANQPDRGGGVPEGGPAASAHAKCVLQEPENSGKLGPEQLVRPGRTARCQQGNGKDPERKNIYHLKKRGTIAHALNSAPLKLINNIICIV